MGNSIDNLITNTIDSLSDILDTSSIIGQPIIVGDKIIIVPICKLTMGLISGGCDVDNGRQKHKCITDSLAGVSGTGISYSPIGLLTIVGDNVKYISVGAGFPISDILDTFKDIINHKGDVE